LGGSSSGGGKNINWKEQLALVVTHPTMLENDEPVEPYDVKKHFKVLTEGPPEIFSMLSQRKKTG